MSEINNLSKTAIVTGATGYVGSNVARRLVSKGWDVHLIIRPQSRLMLIQDIIGDVTLHRHDGTSECMFEIIETTKPTIVFHIASLFLAQHETKDIEPLIQSNVIFGTQLVDAMILNGVYRLINTGTSWQHFENKDYSPVCLYAATKQAFESILKYYIETTPLKTITLKLIDTYGPKDPRPKLFTLLRKVAQEQQPFAMSYGQQLIDLVYIDDVVNAYMLALKRFIKNEVEQQEDYVVSSENPIKLKELVKIYAQMTGKTLLIEWGARPYRPREIMIPWNKGTILSGWKPKVNIEEGIRRMEYANEQKY